MILSAIKAIALSGLIATSSAHHLVSNIWIDGVNQGAGTCMRVPPNTDPLTNIASSNMACNVGGADAVAFTCAAKAGSEVTAQWRNWPDGTQDSPLDASHQGPCFVYMKYMGASSPSGSVAGDGWFKVYEDGVKNDKFCTERIRANGNKMSFTIPKDLAGGHYTVRFEHLALHQAQKVGGAQWFVGCAQVFVYSTGGNRKPSATVSIPGHVTANHPGVLYNLWGKQSKSLYKIPGPAVYVAGNTGGGAPTKVSTFNPHPQYPTCVAKNANWCAVPVPAFNSEASCYASATKCWNQLDVCYSSAPPTGYTGCTAYEAVCQSYSRHCGACGSKCSGSFPTNKARRARRYNPRRDV